MSLKVYAFLPIRSHFSGVLGRGAGSGDKLLGSVVVLPFSKEKAESQMNDLRRVPLPVCLSLVRAVTHSHPPSCDVPGGNQPPYPHVLLDCGWEYPLKMTLRQLWEL